MNSAGCGYSNQHGRFWKALKVKHLSSLCFSKSLAWAFVCDRQNSLVRYRYQRGMCIFLFIF